MINISRRQLARYATGLIADRTSQTIVANHLATALLAMGKSKEYDLLVSDIAYLLEVAGDTTGAKVTVATPLSDSQKKTLRAEIKNLTGAKVVDITEIVDPAIIGGVRVDTAIHSWDNTVSNKITQLRRSFSGG